MFCIPKLLVSQHSVTTLESENQVEYETTGTCLSSYNKELYQIFRLNGLVEDALYTLTVTNPSQLDNLDDIESTLISYLPICLWCKGGSLP